MQRDEHDTKIIGNRKYDNSLIYRCKKCGKSGLGLLGPCAPPSGRTGRRRKTDASLAARRKGE